MSGVQTTVTLIAAFVSTTAALIGVSWVVAQTIGRRIDTLEAMLGQRLDDVNGRLDRIEARVAHLERERA